MRCFGRAVSCKRAWLDAHNDRDRREPEPQAAKHERADGVLMRRECAGSLVIHRGILPPTGCPRRQTFLVDGAAHRNRVTRAAAKRSRSVLASNAANGCLHVHSSPSFRSRVYSLRMVAQQTRRSRWFLASRKCIRRYPLWIIRPNSGVRTLIAFSGHISWQQ